MAQGDTYQIVYNHVLFAMERHEAEQGFAALFRIPPEKAAAILARPGTVLRRGLTAAQAETYREKLQEAGIDVDVRRIPAMPPPSTVARVSGPLASARPASATGTPAMGSWTLEPAPGRAEREPRDDAAAGMAIAGEPLRLGQSLGFEFHGNGLEYCRIWIVNVFLSIVTLGIYSAWAKVRTLQYLYGNTTLAGASFQYLATPQQILKGRLIGFGLLVLYFGAQEISVGTGLLALTLLLLFAPVLLVLGLSARLRFSAWRNVRFDFQRRFGDAYLMAAVPLLLMGGISAVGMLAGEGDKPGGGSLTLMGLAMLLLMIGLPYFVWQFNRFMVDNAAYGSQTFRFGAQPGDYYKLYYLQLPVVLVVSVLGVMGLGWLLSALAGISISEEMQQFMQQQQAAGHSKEEVGQAIGIAATVLIMAAYLPVFACLQARQFNLRYDHLMIGKSILTCEVSAVKLLGLWLSNTVLVVLTLGLYIPWAKLRMVRYRLECLALSPGSDLNEIVNTSHRDNAIGQEIGDLFDFDVAL